MLLEVASFLMLSSFSSLSNYLAHNSVRSACHFTLCIWWAPPGPPGVFASTPSPHLQGPKIFPGVALPKTGLVTTPPTAGIEGRKQNPPRPAFWDWCRRGQEAGTGHGKRRRTPGQKRPAGWQAEGKPSGQAEVSTRWPNVGDGQERRTPRTEALPTSTSPPPALC